MEVGALVSLQAGFPTILFGLEVSALKPGATRSSRGGRLRAIPDEMLRGSAAVTLVFLTILALLSFAFALLSLSITDGSQRLSATSPPRLSTVVITVRADRFATTGLPRIPNSRPSAAATAW